VTTGDGSRWPIGNLPSFFASECPLCKCEPRRWPIAACNTTLMPTRQSFIGTPVGVNAGQHGFGSRVNGMLSAAPYALLNGYGFQLSSLSCGVSFERKPHCFFRSVGNCGAPQVQHLITDSPEAVGRAEYDDDDDDDEFNFRWTKAGAQRDVVGACRMIDPSASCEDRLVAWRTVARLVLQAQPEIMAAVETEYLLRTHSWSSGVFAAMHIRRTDKTSGAIKEADAVPVCMYALQLARMAGPSRRLNVFIATDDLSTVAELAACPTANENDWQLHHFSVHPWAGGLTRLWAEITLLTRAAWTVGTFSSNIGRLAQILRTQLPSTYHSMDTDQDRAEQPI